MRQVRFIPFVTSMLITILVATSGIIRLVLVCKILNVIYWSISIVTLVAKVRASNQ